MFRLVLFLLNCGQLQPLGSVDCLKRILKVYKIIVLGFFTKQYSKKIQIIKGHIITVKNQS